MERKLRIAQYGCGQMSVDTMRYAMEKGAEIVGAFWSHSVGKDIGDIAGVGKTGVLVQDSKDAAAILNEKKPRRLHHYHGESDARSAFRAKDLRLSVKQC